MTAQQQALRYIVQNPGCTMKDVAEDLAVDHPVYGRQRAASTAIAQLRRQGFVEDVNRCEHCKRALTRHHRNVPLRATEKGTKAVNR